MAWLINNTFDISYYRLVPYKIEDGLYIYVEKILAVTDYSDYYVNLTYKSLGSVSGDNEEVRLFANGNVLVR